MSATFSSIFIFLLTGRLVYAQSSSPFQIHPALGENKCLDVRGAVFANGTVVQIYDCNGSQAQNWVFHGGPTQVRLFNTDFCLDAGSVYSSNHPAKIQQCLDAQTSIPAQQSWRYTDDKRLILTQPGGLCLDLTEGDLTNGNPIQIYQCTDYNTHQIWTV